MPNRICCSISTKILDLRQFCVNRISFPTEKEEKEKKKKKKKLESNILSDQFSGNITYNGHGMKEFIPQRTAAYISQYDVHIGELTVRETLAFSARCQGVGSSHGLLATTMFYYLKTSGE